MIQAPSDEADAGSTTATESHAESEADYTAIYFGYASNLSWRTMKQRCPGSLFVGLARLDGWKWAINSTRYANIVQSPGDVVYGSLCFLSRRDEVALDASEGVPDNYQRRHLTVTRLGPDGADLRDVRTGATQVVEALAYVDGTRTETNGQIEPDYVVLVNKAIRDGLACGVPADYVERYLRPFTPPPTEGEEVTMVRTLKRFDLKTPRAPVRGDD